MGLCDVSTENTTTLCRHCEHEAYCKQFYMDSRVTMCSKFIPNPKDAKLYADFNPLTDILIDDFNDVKVGWRLVKKEDYGPKR